MARHPLSTVLWHLHRLLGPGADETTDRQLLERFAEQQDDSAFAMLMQRHGPMVLGVCRRLLDDAHAADDAFQATFLVLVRKAGSLPWRDSVAPWLFQVALRVARKARGGVVRRRASERELEDMTNVPAPVEGLADETARRELRSVLDDELERMPAKYRAPLVLCYLEGKTHEEAARELGWPRGSIAKRLTRAQDLLRDRLAGRGVALSTSTLTAVLVAEQLASAAVPIPLSHDTLRAATLFAAGETLTMGGISMHVAKLAEGVIRAMNLRKMKIALAVLVVLGLFGGGVGLLWQMSLATEAKTSKPAPPLDAAQVKADKVAVVKGNTAFALDLYGKLRVQDGNLFLSPFSVSTALAMSSVGARGQTLDQMAKTLHFPVGPDRLHPAFQDLLQEVGRGGKPRGYQLSVANALWGQKGYGFTNDFLTTTQTHYQSGLQEVDYMGATEEARKMINDWADNQTQGKIKDVIPLGVLNSDTRLVLANAIYFKADWNIKFDKSSTHDAPWLGTTKTVNVPLMFQKASFKYDDLGTFQVLEMPYKDEELSMVVFLPRKVNGLVEFERTLTAAKLDGCLSKLRLQPVEVFLPKFKVTAEMNLFRQLADLGMESAFGRDADFSVIADGQRKLFIQAVLHKSFVEVTEQGTEAAAVTIMPKAESKPPLAPPVPVFRADHPFLFTIRDNRSGSLLFMGRLVQPG